MNVSAEAHVVVINDSDFEERVLKSTLPMIVDFTATWCPPCHALAPIYRQLSAEYAGKLGFAQLDVDENQESVMRFKVMGMPTLVMFYQGQEMERIVGPHPGRLRVLIERALAKNGLA